VFRLIIEYSKLKGFWPLLGNNNNNNNNNRSIYFSQEDFLKESDIFVLVLKLEISYYRVIIIS